MSSLTYYIGSDLPVNKAFLRIYSLTWVGQRQGTDIIFRMKSGLIPLLVCLVITACTAPPVTPPTAPTVELTPWSSPTPAPTQPQPESELIEVVSPPTPSPRTHIIEKGEDLGGLALRYGVPLSDILAANPEVDSRMISIGTAIIIPSESGEEAAPVMQASEAGVTIQPPHCLLDGGGGLTCFAAVRSDGDAPVENISLNFVLLDGDGNEIESGISFAPLNLLPVGASMPLLANFPGVLPASFSVRADLAGALPGGNSSGRYLSHSLEDISVDIASDDLSARVSGQVQLMPDQADAAILWVLAVGYNRVGDVVCFRRWEDAAGLEAGQARAFDFTVYSSIEKIERVEFISEARP